MGNKGALPTTHPRRRRRRPHLQQGRQGGGLALRRDHQLVLLKAGGQLVPVVNWR